MGGCLLDRICGAEDQVLAGCVATASAFESHEDTQYTSRLCDGYADPGCVIHLVRSQRALLGHRHKPIHRSGPGSISRHHLLAPSIFRPCFGATKEQQLDLQLSFNSILEFFDHHGYRDDAIGLSLYAITSQRGLDTRPYISIQHPTDHLAALNHASSDTEAEYDRLRGLARQEAAQRSSCFDRAHQAYESGDGARAHELSEEGKRHASQMDAYNRQARDFIFRANNSEGRVASDTIDLHGLYVEEAEDVLEERIKEARRQGQTHLHVIVGKGNHSRNHVQKIKPRVEQVCQELGLQYATEENEGRMYVNLQGGAVDSMPAPPQAPSYGGYPGSNSHGGQQHGSQQHGGQHQQQNNQNDEMEELVKKGLPKLFRALKGCCVVM